VKKNIYMALIAPVFILSLFAGPGKVQALFCVVVIAAVLTADPAALLEFGSLRLWVFPALFFALAPFMSGVRDGSLFGLKYSFDQLGLGMGFLLHAYAFTVFAAYASRKYSAREIIRAAEKIGMRSAGIRAALASSAVKKLKIMMEDTYSFYRLKRPGVYSSLRDLPVLFSAVIRNAAVIAREISVLFYIRNVRI